jgi:hypothetical protein
VFREHGSEDAWNNVSEFGLRRRPTSSRPTSGQRWCRKNAIRSFGKERGRDMASDSAKLERKLWPKWAPISGKF